MSALPVPTPATAPRRSLFPDRITAGRAQTADRLRRTADRRDRTAALLARITHLDSVTSPDAPPGAVQVLIALCERYLETARLVRALRALACLHDACDVPAPLFAVTTSRHVSTLLASDPVAAAAERPLGKALLWTSTTGTRHAAAVREMADLFERLGVRRPFPLPAVVARNLPRPPQPPPDAATPAAAAFEEWTQAVDAAALGFGLSGAVAHFATLPWREAFDAGIAPDHAAAVVRAYVVGCTVHGPRPFTWRPPPFDPVSLPPAAPPGPPEAPDPESAPDGGGERLAPPDAKTADRLDAQADRLAAEIHKQRNLHEGQALTPRRARARASGQRQADALEPTLAALRALALANHTGTLPHALSGVTTRAAVAELVGTFPGDVPVYPDLDNDLHHRERRGRLRRAGIRDAHDFAAAVEALASLTAPPDERSKSARDAARIRSLTEAARLAGIPDYFFSPPAVTDAILDAAGLPHDAGPDFHILDPSAGDGAILDAARARLPHARLDAAEVNPRLRDILDAKGYAPVGRDALAVEGSFDRILMNPPFGRGGVLAMPHVRHAYTLLRPGGRLVAVVPESCFFRKDVQHRTFREWAYGLGGSDRSLPYDAFAPAGTTVATRLLILDKPAG